MSITDELREWMRVVLTDDDPAHAIADRIDIAHKHAIGYVDDRDPETMAENGWVRGPLDADGKMWRSGDMSDSNWGVIEGIAYEDGTWYVKGHDTSAPWIRADSIGHYHEQTVEDVLREFAEKITDSQIPNVHPTYEEAIAEYAAKFCLVGDGKE